MKAVVQRVTRASVTGQSGGAGPGGAAPDPAPGRHGHPREVPPRRPRAAAALRELGPRRRAAPAGLRCRPRARGVPARPELQGFRLGFTMNAPHYFHQRFFQS